MIKIIVAIGKNNEMGIGDKLLGHFPEDLKHFKHMTRGNLVVVGKKTFDGFPEHMKEFPSRYGIILTSDPESVKHYLNKKVSWSDSLIKLVESYKNYNFNETINMYISGGESVYRAAMELPELEELIVTHINKEFPEATHFFPYIDLNIWHETESWNLTEEMTVIRYVRK